MCSALLPDAVCASTAAPRSTSSSATARCRFCKARYSGVMPSEVRASTAAFPFVFCSASSGMYAISLQGSKREYLAACDGM